MIQGEALVIILKQITCNFLHGMWLEDEWILFKILDAHGLQTSTNPCIAHDISFIPDCLFTPHFLAKQWPSRKTENHWTGTQTLPFLRVKTMDKATITKGFDMEYPNMDSHGIWVIDQRCNPNQCSLAVWRHLFHP